MCVGTMKHCSYFGSLFHCDCRASESKRRACETSGAVALPAAASARSETLSTVADTLSTSANVRVRLVTNAAGSRNSALAFSDGSARRRVTSHESARVTEAGGKNTKIQTKNTQNTQHIKQNKIQNQKTKQKSKLGGPGDTN